MDMDELHPDRQSFDTIWAKVINIEIQNYKEAYPNCILEAPNIADSIWEKYVELNSYCKRNYMKSQDGKLDRHKVAACYMIAIVMTKPLILKKGIDTPNMRLAINESLAITVGLSLIRAFIISALNQNRDMAKEDAQALIKKYDTGIQIPDTTLVNHGDYLENFARELSFAYFEGKLNILSIAHELFLLEILTRFYEE